MATLFVFLLLAFTTAAVNQHFSFFQDFAWVHHRQAIVLYINDRSSVRIQNWYRRAIKKKSLEFPCMFLQKSMNNRQISQEDIHIFTTNLQQGGTTTSLDYVTKKFMDVYTKRPIWDRSYWLFDISAYATLVDWEKSFSDLELDIDENLFLYSSFSINRTNSHNITIWECYQIHPTKAKKIVFYGTWNIKDGLSISSEDKWVRRKDLEGINFKITNLPEPPYTNNLEQRTENDHEYGKDGYFQDIWHILQDLLNFSYTVNLPPDEQWGSLQSNGTWNGMINELLQKRADIAPAALYATYERRKVVSFAHPISRNFYEIYIAHPKDYTNYLAYIEPLNKITWIFVGFMCIIAAPFLYIAIHKGKKDSEEFTLIKCGVFALNCLLMGGWHGSPTKNAARITFLTIMMFGVLMNTAWQANLISSLTISQISLPFTSLEQLVTMSNYKIAISPGSAYEDLFKLSFDPIRKKAWEEKIQPYLKDYQKYDARNMTEVLKSDPLMSVVRLAAVGRYAEMYQKCEALNLPEKFEFIQVAYAFQKYSPYLKLFNYYLKKLEEGGTFYNLKNKYNRLPRVCSSDGGKPIGFSNTITAFIAFLIGMALGAFLLILELFYHHKYKSSTREVTAPLFQDQCKHIYICKYCDDIIEK